MALAEIYARHLNQQKEEKSRDQHRLYVTDLGKCKRQVAYRLLGSEKNPKLDETVINETIMFGLADYLEVTLADALEEDFRLIKFQHPISMPDRENWGGRLDIIAEYEDGARIIEVKSVRSNKFNYSDELPDKQHIYQVGTYDHYVREEGEFDLELLPLLWYVDRGGSNTPLEFEVDYSWDEIRMMMDELDMVREDVINKKDVLPDRLEKLLKLRSYGKKIVYEPPWNCGYCDYSDICNPDMKKQDWANLEKSTNIWIPTRVASLLQLKAFAETMTQGKVGNVF